MTRKMMLAMAAVVVMMVGVGAAVKLRRDHRRLAALEAHVDALADARAEDGQARTASADPRWAAAVSLALATARSAKPGAPAEAMAASTPPEQSSAAQHEPPPPERQVDHVASLFAAQPVAADWANDAEARISAGLGKAAGEGSRVRGVECRSSLCRATLVHDGEEQYQAFVAKAFSSAQFWDGASFCYRDPTPAGGAVTSTLFYARIGTEMPYLD